jgi:hypothetical protein
MCVDSVGVVQEQQQLRRQQEEKISESLWKSLYLNIEKGLKSSETCYRRLDRIQS